MRRPYVFALLACLPTLAAAQSIRCGSRVISEGANQAQVSALCGQPANIERRTVSTGVVSTGTPPGVVVGETADVPIEIWTYNFGPNRLMQRIRFEDGVVVRIDSVGYGY